MQSAVQADQSVLHGDGKLDYVDNSKSQLAEVAEAAMAEDVESEDVEEMPENGAELASNEEKTADGSATLFND